MLLLHQVGSVKIGEVVRYTVTYTPSQDRILPSPERLYVRIRNTSAIALRAAFVHGPYTLSVAAYPSCFDPNEKFANPRRYGVPEYEPMLKAGGSWECELVVPDDIRQAAGTGRHGGFGKGPEHDAEHASWVIEVSSQVIFSSSAAVGYELVVARERKSLNLGNSLPIMGGQAQVPQPGRVSDHQQSIGAKDGHHPSQPKGVFSRAVQLKVEDTATLWNTPRLPGWDDAGDKRVKEQHGADEPVESVVKTGDPETEERRTPRKQKRVHLVVLSHGLHSNLGADMLYIKESIDTAVRQAKVDAKERRAKEKATKEASKRDSSSQAEDQTEDDKMSTEEPDKRDEDDDDDEEVIVRGYSGNATKTERGIKYLGKRLARYVLSMAYPDQPYLPLGKGVGESYAQGFRTDHGADSKAAHKHSTIRDDEEDRQRNRRPYKITSISFIAHSLGGLVQTYAVAYIQKHSPQFFDLIKPMHFICLASPFLGLSNENPVYVRFALDFGLVGRTGKDLGLAWRAPTIARSGWGAIVGNLGETAQKKVYGETQPESKPLLRILPTGPAHIALKKFHNRTVYSNVVNDGIVPLRTSCLLFLDWQGLGRVEKARRDAGLVETMVGFGWAELTGTNMAGPRPKQKRYSTAEGQSVDSGPSTPGEEMFQVPQPGNNAIAEDDKASLRSIPSPYDEEEQRAGQEEQGGSSSSTMNHPLSGFFNFFKSNDPPKAPVVSPKQKKAFRRGQTLSFDEASSATPESSNSDVSKQNRVTTGNEMEEDPEAPPRTTVFESAHDLLNPKMPDVEFLIDPSKRPRTIFHDRVYHPTDIPPPPLKKRATSLMLRKTFSRSPTTGSQQSANSGSSSPYPPLSPDDSVSVSKDGEGHRPSNSSSKQSVNVVDSTDIRVEEKIARAYHRDLAWRKVLVKLEPDAHNNIFVRRMFVNAYGWPVIKHMVDAHFSDSAVARLRTDDEHLGERALDMNQPPNEHGGETKADPSSKELLVTKDGKPAADVEPKKDSSTPPNGEVAREAMDQVPDLPNLRDPGSMSMSSASTSGSGNTVRPGIERIDSMTWSERDWVDSDNDSEQDHASHDGSHASRASTSDGKDKDKDRLHVTSPGGGHGDDHGGGLGGRMSPSSWNWAEKIVGKGGMASKSRGRDD